MASNKENLNYSVVDTNSEVVTLKLDNVKPSSMKVIPLITELKLEDITTKRALIRASCRDRYPTVTSELIERLFWQYDTIFLNNFMAAGFRAMKYCLKIEVEPLTGGHAGFVSFEGKNFKLSINSDYAKIVPFGKKCKSGYDRLAHLMRTIEHEIIHILHLVHPSSDKSQDHHGLWFNMMSKRLFLHDNYRDY